MEFLPTESSFCEAPSVRHVTVCGCTLIPLHLTSFSINGLPKGPDWILYSYLPCLPHQMHCVSVYVLSSFALYIKRIRLFNLLGASLCFLGGDSTL